MMWYLHICSSVWVLPLKQKWTQQKHLHWYLIVSHTHGAPKHTYNTACSHVYMYECEWERAHPETSYTHTKSINVCMLACTHTHTHALRAIKLLQQNITSDQIPYPAVPQDFWSNPHPLPAEVSWVRPSHRLAHQSHPVRQKQILVIVTSHLWNSRHCNITPM